jgi:hypothetical protein
MIRVRHLEELLDLFINCKLIAHKDCNLQFILINNQSKMVMFHLDHRKCQIDQNIEVRGLASHDTYKAFKLSRMPFGLCKCLDYIYQYKF